MLEDMSPPATARLDQYEDDDLPAVPVLPPDVQAELHRRLSEVDDLRAQGLLIDADDVLFDD